MNPEHSVTKLIQQLEHDPSSALQQLWDRFIGRLITAADKHLRNLPRRVADEEDVAIVAFASFARGAAEGRFQRLENRDDLWQVLAMLIERKSIALLRHELADKRGGGQVRGESVFEKLIAESSVGLGIDQVGDPSPQLLDHFTYGVREMLDSLGDETLREIAILKLEGYTNDEIATKRSTSLRSIERKLQMIREKWTDTDE